MGRQEEREIAYPCLIGTAPLAAIPSRYLRNPLSRQKYFRRISNYDNDLLICSPRGWECEVDADPRLEYMMMAASKFLPSGWQVVTGALNSDTYSSAPPESVRPDQTNGCYLRPANQTVNHYLGTAIDVYLVTNKGLALSNVRNWRTFRTYELFAQIIAKLIYEKQVTDLEGNVCDWSDLRHESGKPQRPGLGLRRQFDETGKEFFSKNENGVEITAGGVKIVNGEKIKIPAFVQRYGPAQKYNIGFRWGGYFGDRGFYKEGEEDLARRDFDLLGKDENYKGAVILYWDNREQIFKKRPVKHTTPEGIQFEIEEPNNVFADCMHFDFRGNDGESGWFPNGLTERQKSLLTVPAEFRPDGKPFVPQSIGVRDFSQFQLPQTAEECRIRFEETLGIEAPKGYRASKPAVAYNTEADQLQIIEANESMSIAFGVHNAGGMTQIWPDMPTTAPTRPGQK